MTRSIKVKYAAIFSVLLAIIIILTWICNVLFLGRFYISRKTAILKQTYTVLDNAASLWGESSEEFQRAYYNIADRYNLDVLILDPDMNVVTSNAVDDKKMAEKLIGYFIQSDYNTVELYKGDKYTIQRASDNFHGSEFVELWGIMTSGNMIVMRSPISSMKESAEISNLFMAYIGVIAIFLSIFPVFFVTRTVTRPILKLVDISDRMAKLDFEAKYEGTEQNEIDILGEHMNQLSATLEKTISELKTANNELKSDLEKKTELEEMRKEFLSNVSHELKTPIALIQGYAEGLMDCVNDDEDSKNFYCEVIADEANKMNRLVKSLMELNELESGGNKSTFERFDIVELINNIVNSHDILLKQNGIKYIFNQNEPEYVWSDEMKVEQVISNYISNAIHYANGPEKLIQIKLSKAEDKVRVEVFNTGNPIPEDEIGRLWDKFYKVDKARSREYGGSGVGLSIVKAALDSLNQEYGVNNYENGVGFWFEVDGSNI